MNDLPLNGKIALVTGGGRGIGRATALELARLGADVAIAARTSSEIDEVAAAIKVLGRRAVAVTSDLADSQAAVPLVEAVEKALGLIDILINNAGIVGPFGPSWTLDTADWEQAVHINLVAPFLLAHRVLPNMLTARWGRIINVSSGIARNPVNNIGAYAVTKAALDMFTRQLGGELADTNVTTTAIYPGAIETAMSTKVRGQAQLLGKMAVNMQQMHDDGRMGQPENPARLIAQIILAQDTKLNGQVVDLHSEIGQHLLTVNS